MLTQERYNPLDRRDALKKLGAAGAIVAGGSMVLGSNSVAFAASADTCLTGIPSPTGSLPLRYSVSGNRTTLTISVDVAAKCNCTARVTNATTSYRWDATPTYTLQPPNTGYRVQRNGNVSSKTSTLVRKNSRGQNTVWVNGDTYSLNVRVTWQCRNAPKRIEAQYRVSGTYPNAPVATVLSYTTV